MQWTVLGYPLYGHRVGTLLRMRPQREGWLSGGRYGPESSAVVAAVEVVAATIALLALMR